MGDIREINHTYRIDPRNQQSISFPKKLAREQPQKDEREPPHDEIVISHHEDDEPEETSPTDSKSVANPEEIPGLDISA